MCSLQATLENRKGTDDISTTPYRTKIGSILNPCFGYEASMTVMAHLAISLSTNLPGTSLYPLLHSVRNAIE